MVSDLLTGASIVLDHLSPGHLPGSSTISTRAFVAPMTFGFLEKTCSKVVAASGLRCLGEHADLAMMSAAG
jgi:hypothetical protein